ncbi:hypothetical protein SAMN02745111_00346 [Eubacterium uniforme]|uniref:Uncharacterized protein n=1 Tax=Eubacterium uniforme TaxID=39495 RepID=A0A1T4V7Q7_9FIRM|nr:hypothetical protein [Eubacterium uniforme]SKA61018.1 hypothetical protein SAMN02745111_00346 [Eubacterium uniforme]
MIDTSNGVYVYYSNKKLRYARINDVLCEVPVDNYIYISNDEDIDDKCTKWGNNIIRPITSEEIEYLYEIDHYVLCNGRKYKWYHVKKEENIIQVDADEYEDVDTKYKYVIHDRDAHFLEVPIDEVTLYETKTYYDKDKFINEDIREVLSEETYLIDEPWWLEESDKN